MGSHLSSHWCVCCLVFPVFFFLFVLSWPEVLAGTCASTSPTPPCRSLQLHAGTGIKDKAEHLKAWTGIFFINWSLFHVSPSPTFSLAGREISYALTAWAWRWRNRAQCLGSSTLSLETLIWNRGKDEHVSESVKNQQGLLLKRENRQETMLFWISYVSNQDFVPCS